MACPWHGAEFDVRTGGVLGPPAATGVESYLVKVTGKDKFDPSTTGRFSGVDRGIIRAANRCVPGGRRIPTRVVTISHATGAGGETIGRTVSDRLGVRYIDEEIITLAAEKEGVDAALGWRHRL